MKGIFLEWPSGSHYPNQSVGCAQGADTISTGELGSPLLGYAFSPFLSPLSFFTTGWVLDGFTEIKI